MMNLENKYDTYYKAALYTLSQTGSVEDVFRYIDSIKGNDGDYRDSTLGKFACFLASQQKTSDAMRFCSAVSDPLERADSMFAVAGTLQEEKLFDSAKEFLNKAVESAEATERSYNTAMVFLQIADLLRRLGERTQATELLHRAVELARPRPQAFEAAKTVRGCARLLAKWNRLPEAIEVAQAIDSRWSALRQTALEEVQGRGQWPVHPVTDDEGNG